MRKFKNYSVIVIFIALAVLAGTGDICAYQYLSGLVVNFSDFSFVRSITAGYEYAYVGTTNGITRFNISNNTWDLPLTGISGLLGGDILRIQTSRNDEYLWVETELGKFEYNRTHNFWTQISQFPPDDGFVRHLRPEPVYFAPQGFNYLPNGVLVDFENRRFPLTDIIDDGWSNLWIGTWGLGVIRADNSNYQMELLNYGLLYQDVSCLSVHDGRLWVGGELTESLRHGLTIYSIENNSFNYAQPDYSRYSRTSIINDIAIGSENAYAATNNGLLVVDNKDYGVSIMIQSPPEWGIDKALNCVAARGDSVFVGLSYGVGLIRFLDDSISFEPTLFLPDLTALSMESSDDALWIGTDRGVYRLVYASGIMEQLNIWQVSGATEIFDITIGPDKIWIATGENLIAIDPETGAVVDYPEVYSYNGVRSVDSQGDIVAAATGNGLLLFFFGKKKYHNYLYTQNDGLPSNNIKTVKFDGDYLWVGSDQGLTRFWHRHPGLYH
jgi:ligand-binding sensor domain-containing protein